MKAVTTLQSKPTIRWDNAYARGVCAQLRAIRTESGLAASDVAEHLEIPTSLYVLYEEYELIPHQMIVPLCEFLNISPWQYLNRVPDELTPADRCNRQRLSESRARRPDDTNLEVIEDAATQHAEPTPAKSDLAVEDDYEIKWSFDE